MRNTIHELLEYGPIVAHDEELDILITVNGAYFNYWAGDGTGTYVNVEAYDRSSRVDDDRTWREFVRVWETGESVLATITSPQVDAEYYLIVDGAADATIYVDYNEEVVSSEDPGSSPNTLDEWVEDLKTDSMLDRPWAIYRIGHGHALSDVGDCACAQFETSHLPWYEAS